MIKNENKRFSVTVPKELYEKLSKDAEYEDRSVSNLAARILKQYYNMKLEDDK